MFFIDTHCHLYFEAFRQNINQFVDRALENGVKYIIVPGVDLQSSEEAVSLASGFDCIYAAIGVHPTEIDEYQDQQYSLFERLAKEKKVVAIGEIGLDFYHHPETKNKQLEILDSMLDLADKIDKPVILHSRKSLDLLMEKVYGWMSSSKKTMEKKQGVFHSFEGNPDQAIELRKHGMCIGIGGPVTFRNANEKQSVVKRLGLDGLVLETDSPYLSPQPFRGQTNEPSRIPIIAQKVADLLELTIEEVGIETSTNAQLLFRLEKNL